MPLNARKITQELNHPDILKGQKLRNALFGFIRGQRANKTLGKTRYPSSPDFLPLRPPLLEGVLLLVGPLHAGHLVLRRRKQGQLWYV